MADLLYGWQWYLISVGVVLFLMAFVAATACYGERIHRPHWPERYPHARRPRPFPAFLAALSAAGRLLRIRWPCWLLGWAWDRQATPGPGELLRQAHKARHKARRGSCGDKRARGRVRS
jgi:hypothetical protein